MPGLTTADKARRLREMHARENWPLVLPNAWDAASARIFEEAGFGAIATTSAGIAYALGYADGQRVSQQDMVEVAARIARTVKVPVTADVESGYRHQAQTARALWDAGVVGMNLEDSEDGRLLPADEHVRRIRAVKAAVPAIVVNARVDVFLDPVGDVETRLERTVQRFEAFEEAGADSLFVPGVGDEATISALVAATRLPVNILAMAGVPPVDRLRELGVGRITIGSGGMRATMALVRRIAVELHESGTYESFTRESVPYAEMNRLFE